MKSLLYGPPARPPAERGDARREPWMDDPERRDRLGRIARLLSDLAPPQTEALVYGLVRRFARRVHDLPATEFGHHRGPWGLLDHSLEVAEAALRGSFGASFLDSAAAPPEDREFRRPRLRYLSFVLGLLHEAGMILRLGVRKGPRSWNPLAEDLVDFAGVEEPPAVLWPGEDAPPVSELEWALFLGRFLAPPISRYLTAGLVGEILDRESPAGKRMSELVRRADAQSARQDRIQQAQEEEGPPTDFPRLAYPAGRVEWTDLLARAFAEGLDRSMFKINTAPGDLWLGKDYAALRYPTGARKLAALVRQLLHPSARFTRKVRAGEPRTRELVHELIRHGLVYCDPATRLWKVQMSLALRSHAESVPAFLIRRSFPIAPSSGKGEEGLFDGEASFSRAADGLELKIPGFQPKKTRAKETGANGPKSPPKTPRPVASSGPPRASSPQALPAHPLSSGKETEAPGTLEPDILLENLRQALLQGILPSNVWNAPAYVLEAWTYLVVPATFRRLAEAGLYPLDPCREWGRLMEALSRLDCVRLKGAWPDLARIRLREGAKFCTAVVLETCKLFPAPADRVRVGYWTGSALTEEPRQAGSADGPGGEPLRA